MKNILKIFTILPMVGLLSACGTQVEVPPAKVGKIMTKDGYREGMVTTSRFRLDRCIWYCDRLILLDVSDRTAKEDMTIFIPEDKLNLNVGIQVTLSLAGRNVEPLFNSIPPDATENPVVSVIEWNSIYNTYARQVVLTETREYLSQFSIAEISSSLEKN